MMAACAGDYPCSGEIAQQCEVWLVGSGRNFRGKVMVLEVTFLEGHPRICRASHFHGHLESHNPRNWGLTI